MEQCLSYSKHYKCIGYLSIIFLLMCFYTFSYCSTNIRSLIFLTFMPISLILHLQERNGNPLQYSCLENSMGYSPWGHKELDITERLHFHFHFSRKEIGLPGGLVVKNLPAMQETWVPSLVGKIPQRRKRQHTPVFLPGKCHGQRSLKGYSPWDGKRVRYNLATKQ